MKKIILASSSPRRKELLSEICPEFEIIRPVFDETKFHLEPNGISVEELSLLKVKSILNKCTVSSLIIGADTVVILDNKIIGKPKNREHAYEILKSLSGKTHKVITGISIFDTDTKKEYKDFDLTYVKFNILSDEDINNYIEDKKPYDKAGAYGIQEIPKNFLKEINGNYDNVIGLPTKILINMLKKINY
ncbi:septum formation protein Maf [bacterium]|nr:septum formation protein Maf [bacterium]